jgi:iron complex outermembrane receptor protein
MERPMTASCQGVAATVSSVQWQLSIRRFLPLPYALDNLDLGRANWVGGDYRLVMTTLPAHKLMLGIETQWNTLLEQRNFDVLPATSYLESNQTSNTLGVFVQDEWRLSPQWLLNLGLRHDKHSDYSAITSPRAALIYQPNENATLKAMVGSAYRAPNAYERFYDDGGVLQKANPALLPERIRSVELAADFRLGQAGAGKHLPQRCAGPDRPGMIRPMGC